jgi:Protein of unknown function (DUF2783)
MTVTSLVTEPNIERVDDVYQWLVDAQEGLEDDDALRFYARLILTLFNHIGDESIIRASIQLAASVPAEVADS